MYCCVWLGGCCDWKFDANKSYIKAQIQYEKYSMCEYFEVLPFSYQRLGFKKGMLIENYYALKDKSGTYLYGFNSDDKIIEIKEGVSLESEFCHQFFFYEILSIPYLRRNQEGITKHNRNKPL